MEVRINTKFGLNDKPYAFCNGELYQFAITDISINWKLNYGIPEILYECHAIITDSHLSFVNKFEERELHTLDEIKQMIINLEDKQQF